MSGEFPTIRDAGLAGFLVSFASALDEPSNRAALAFRAALEAACIPGVTETSPTLVSVFLRFDPAALRRDDLRARLSDLLASRDWMRAPLPPGRRLWRVPAVFGGALGPQLGEAADMAGLSEAAAVERLGAAQVRVLAIGFAPGQPYLGPLGEEWDLPRQTGLTPKVPRGALALAIRQLVLFSKPSPTGWRHVGQTGFQCWRPGAEQPVALRPGDEMRFEPVPEAEFTRITGRDPDMGGARAEEIAP